MDDKSVKIKEGREVKGGVNPKPSTPRPSEPPKAQRPHQEPKPNK
jgi:hypothetical protein